MDTIYIPRIYRTIKPVSPSPSPPKKTQFETFDNEDLKPNFLEMILNLQAELDNCVKKTGDTVSGNLHVLKPPCANMDAVNKEYVDGLYSTLADKIEASIAKNADIDMNHFKIKNVQSPKDLGDVVNKNYVDDKFESTVMIPFQHVFSKGQIISGKKTFFFNPGFVCPRKINITSVGFATSPRKYKIGEKLKPNTVNPTKLYFMINSEIQSEFVIDKDIQMGYLLKHFNPPVVVEKEDNVMLIVETPIEDASVNIEFY